MDVTNDRLYRSFLNGSQVTVLVNSGIQCSEGLAWDWINEKLYWTDYCQDEIEVYDPASSHRRVLLTTGTSPYSIVVDPGTGWLYWSDTGTRRIERASMDGNSRTALHTTNLQTPYALTIDYATQTLYWADYALNKLESSNTDGSNRRLLTTNIRDPYFMTFFEGTLYWSDLSYNGIYSTLSSSPSRVTSLLSIGSDPYGIQVIDKDLQFEVPNPCAEDNGNCSHMCLLSAASPSGFSCSCPNDYVLTENQTHCKPPPRLLFSVYSNTVRRVNTDGQNLVTLYTASYPRALDFDFQQGYVFWVDFSNDRIVRGLGVETPSASYTNLVTSGISCADGLAWDWINEKLYWTDYCQDDIEVYDPSTGYRAVLFNTGLIEPHAIVVDPTTKFLYWTDVGSDRIEKASMDGSSRNTLHSGGLNTVYGITLDYDNQVLYWADYSNNRIEKSFTNGTNRVMLTSSGITDPFGITYFAGRLYWTDWSAHRIYTLSVNSPTAVSQVTGSFGVDLYGIHVVTKERQPSASNHCLGNNCSHICLLSSTRPEGYKCACPPGLVLDNNLSDCKASLGLLFTLYQPYVRRIDLDGSDSVTLYSSGAPFAVDYDYRNNYLFWSDVTNDRIWRAELDGSSPVILVNTGIPCVGGLAWDWVNQKLYWTDYCDDDIEVFDPVTRQRRVLFDVDLTEPYAIVVDPTTGWMYWTDAGTNRIERSTMDGNSRTVLHSSGLSNVYGLTLDYQNQTLYWVDYSNNRVERSSVTGSNRVTLRTGLRDPWSVTYYSGRLYWTDWYYDRIYSIIITSPSTITTITSLGANSNGIHVISAERQPLVANPCSNRNCTSLCLISAASPTRSNCSCPTGFVINANQTECVAPPRLLFTQITPYIRRVDLDGRRVVTVYTGGQPRGIDFDYRRYDMFWTDDTYNRIWRAKLNGTQASIMISTRLSCPDGIAWDWINEKLYWTDTCNDVIEVYDPATGYRSVLLYTGTNSNNRDIVVDPTTGWLYWTDYYSTVPKIQRISMDGTAKTILHDTSLNAPYGLTLDYDTQTLYWTDYTLNKIEKSNADGSNRALVTTSLVNDAYSITFFDGRLYWTDLSYNRILTTPINSPRPAYLSGSLNDMYGITAITEDRQPIVQNPCGSNGGNCSHFCLLSSTRSEGYRCGCPDGMMLIDETNCGPSPYLLFTRYSSNIQRVYLDGTMYTTIYSGGYTSALDFDYRRGYMFWSDTNSDRIYRAWINGTGATVLISSGLSNTYGLAWDWINEKLYWADASTDRIEVYDPNTRNRKLLISTGSSTNPADIIVDPNNGWMYWTDYGTVDKIERASMDGTSRIVLHNTDLSAPYGLTLDYTSQTLYWMDYNLDKLESSNADGSSRRLLTRVNIQCPWGITYYDQKLYWSDHCQHVIYTTFVNTPNSVSTLVSTGNDPYRLHVISEERQPITITNPCGNNSGNCSHFCLLSATNASGYSCACPDSLVLDDNQRDCIIPPFILIADNIYLRRMDIDGSGYRSILTYYYVRSLDFDYRKEYIFWSDTSNDRIIRSYLNTTQRMVIVSGGMSCVNDIAWDWINEKLYWTDDCQDDIEVYDPATTYRRMLFNRTTSVINPRGIVVDPITGWFYWTDYGTDTIERASMDGNSRMILHSTDLRDTYTITIDYENQLLYWADYTLNRIERSNVDGSNRMILTTSIRDPSSISYYNGRLYWGDYALNRMLNGPASSPGSGTYIGGGVSYDVYGIQVISRDLQPLRSNPCLEDNGNCTHICLLSSTYPEGYGCNCPDGLVLAGDGRTCSMCPANSFICDNAVCIPSIWECDSIDDCGDNSDEDHCNDSDVEYLPFVKLRNTTNVVKKDLPPADDTTSADIDVPVGFAFGNTSQTTVYVATNGYISFGQRVTSLESPSLFSESSTPNYIIAPYWSDIDTRSAGSVSYELHTNVMSPSLLRRVSKYIRQREQNSFAGTWMLVAEWNSIPSPEPRYGDLRLVRGTVTDGKFSSGRLEIYINGQWGTICDDFFDQTDANVACKQLGFSRAITYRTSASGGFNSGSGPIWLDDLQCTVSDTRLISCTHRAVGTHSCGHSEDIAVYCNTTNDPRIVQNNTFQGLIITNGFQSYTVFTYRCGLMGWSGNATIGYKAKGERFMNNTFSGNGARLVACQNYSSNTSWTNIIYKLNDGAFPYLTLGVTPNVSRTYFPSVVDGSSEAIHIPRGFPFGRSNQTTVFVSTNGFFSFGEVAVYNTPQRFSSSSPPAYIVAPFWANNDISNRVGNITYEIHSTETSPSYIILVSSFISQQQQVKFRGNWMLVAHWNSVPQFGGSLTDTNTYQGILITNGQQSYALFTYQCGQLGWSGGATIGFSAAGNFYQNHRLSGMINARNIACLNSPGNRWTNIIYQLNDNFLPFLELGITRGVARNYLPNVINASSVGVNIPDGFTLGTSNQTLVYLTSNGYFSFGREAHLHSPILFPESDFYNYLVAPYWVNFDIRQSGQISYEVHSSVTGLMSLVNTFIQQQDDEDFVGTWMMVANFKETPQDGSIDNRTSSFQGIIITNGNQSYAVFTYLCGALSSSESMNYGTIGFNSDGSYFRNYPLSQTQRLYEVACLNHPRTMWSNLVYALTPTSELDVSITSTPSGPSYQAATWISFQCQATSGSGVYSYKWKVYCSSTGVQMFESRAGSDTTFRIKSTPPVCFNKVECIAEDMVLPLSGSASVSITTVTGVGLFANDNPASNISAVLADGNNQIGTIYCSSGSQANGIGQWFAPNGAEITQSSGGSLTVARGGGSFPSYVGLQLKTGRSFSMLDEGVYTCVIPDENGVQQTLYVGLYNQGYFVTPTGEITSASDPMFILKCTTTGAPAVVTWSYSGTSRMYTNDGRHRLSQSLLNRVTSTFESRLEFLSHPYPSDTGERVCIATATYISANSSETNPSTAVGETHFAMYSSGEAVSINCIDSSGTANLVQWINSTGTVLTSSSSTTVTLTIASVTDQHHGTDYICRIHSSGVSRDLNYTIIVLVPPSPLMTQINPSSAGTQRAGSGYSLTCIVLKAASGLTRSAQTLWRGPDGVAIATGGSVTVADPVYESLRTLQTVTFSSLSTAHAGVYSCEGTLSSPALTSAYQATTSYTVTISVSPPRIEISINSGQFHSDSRIMLLCTINLPETVNSEVNVAVLWLGPSGQLRNSSDVSISSTYEVTNGVFQSSVTISNYVTLVDNGDYTCNASVIPISPYVIGISAVGRKRVSISELGLIVQTEPSTVTVLDAAPYNIFSIVCTASVPTNVTATKSFVWRRGPSGTGTVLSSSEGTTITTLNPGSAVSTSVLTANASTPGSFVYTCDVTVISSLSSAATTVVVNGPRSPSQPTSVHYINTTHSTATIEWRIPSISYTPETYYIEYGTSPSVLDQQSRSIRSGSDLTITNQLYSVDITGLTSNTTYYYRVVASNSFASTSSTPSSFVTVTLPLVVLVRAQGVPRTGEMYQLTCTVTKDQSIMNTPLISWVVSGVQIASNGSGITLRPSVTNDTISSSVLEFDPLTVTHEGDYTCQAIVGTTNISYTYAVSVERRSLDVSVTVSPPGVVHQASSSLNLTCGVSGQSNTQLSYQWTSTCTGTCFVLRGRVSNLMQTALHSIDSGNHTCSVTDAFGNRGMATVQIAVVGVGIHYLGVGLLDNNTFVTADTDQTLSDLHCSSGSTMPNAGRWIAPNGNDLTNSTVDPFNIIQGDERDPGSLIIQQAPGHIITNSFQGVYTCVLPNDNGVLSYIHVGIYRSGFNSQVTIASLESSSNFGSLFTLNCISSGSPASSVTWRKDGELLSESGAYRMSQVLQNGATATYFNLLEVNSGPYALTGEYSCQVSNSLGTDTRNTTIEGLSIRRSNNVFTVGESASVTCTSDLDVTSIEWLYNLQVVSYSTASELQLVFSPVNDSIHGREYTCRVTSSYGIQELTVQPFVQIPIDDVQVMAMTEGVAIAGQQYRIMCIVVFPLGLTNPITVQWYGSNGLIASSGGGITLGETLTYATNITSSLEFNPLRASHGGQFSCRATITSSAPPYSLTRSVDVDILVEVAAVLQVNISSSPVGETGVYQAGSSVTLTCQAYGGSLPLTYVWNSTCGNCFVLEEAAQSTTRSPLHSRDSGTHTCSVVDYVGHSGFAMIQMSVSGVALYLVGIGPVQNNSIIRASITGRFNQLQCISGSSVAGVGQWIAPHGGDINGGPSDPFTIITGDANNPGFTSIELEDGASLAPRDQGVYTCVIPDENGNVQYLYVGIYLRGFNTLPQVSSLQLGISSNSPLALNCSSVGSPAYTVVWTKDGSALPNDFVYTTTQTLTDGTTAAYDNLLEISGYYSTVVGVYSCIIHDSLGRNSAPASLQVNGLEIAGYDGQFAVGEYASITCSFDLEFISIQWIYNNEVIASSSSSSIDLSFSPVNDSIHGRQYTCRVTTQYGVQEQNVTIVVQVPDTSIETSVSSVGLPVAGYNFTLICTVTLTEGLLGSPTVWWVDGNGQQIRSAGDIVLYDPVTYGLVTNLTLYFDPIRIRDEGSYMCMATVSSPAHMGVLNASFMYLIDVQLTYPLTVVISNVIEPDHGPVYAPGSSVQLMCSVDGPFPIAVTRWNSTCTGNCFVLQQSTQQSIMKNILHATDGGNHTCTIVDDVGNTGSATVEIFVSGVQLYSFDPDNSGPLPNNSIVVTDNFGQMPRLQCISGSNSPSVGQWIAPSGQDVTYSTSDPFDVVLGSVNDPGYMDIALHSGQFITFSDQGIYTCFIPDETGVSRSLLVGIYLPALITPVRITSLEESAGAMFTLNCTSVGSPATNVTWTKDGEIVVNDTFEVIQILQDGVTAMYSNLLKVYSEPSDVIGVYTCSVDNSVSEPAVQIHTIQGLTFAGSTNIGVGQNATISCISDLSVQSVQWVFNDDVVATSNSQQVDLTFSPVFDYLHNREYACRAMTAYGMLERRITITVEIPENAVRASITTVGNEVAGEMYSIVCEAVLEQGIQSTPILAWYNSVGERVVSSDGISVGPPTATTLPVEFSILRVSHSGQYTCQVTLYSLALQTPLTASTSITLNIASDNLDVSITSMPLGPDINAAEFLSLTCQTTGGTGVYTYQWSSNCTGNCFLNNINPITQTITRDALRSTDSGLYTCTVIDNAGNNGSDSTQVQVIGAGFYVGGGVGHILNNSILETSSDGRIPQLLCLSGSSGSAVGQWIGPDGTILTTIQSDPFDVIFGDNNNPGQMTIETPMTNPSIMATHQGVYTCMIPNESDNIEYLRVGIYPSGSSVAPTVSSLAVANLNSSVFTLNCTSTDSPATTVVWTKGSELLSDYPLFQILRDGVMATYNNFIGINTGLDGLVGAYSCSVLNSAGLSNVASLNIQGIQIIGDDGPLILGSSAQFTCSSDLDILLAEWLFDGQVVVEAEASQATLIIPTVNDSLHNGLYVCRITTLYGIQERNMTITVTVPASAVNVSTLSEGTGIAGQRYVISCSVSQQDALSVVPEITWRSPDGMELRGQMNSTNFESIMVYSASLEFNPLLASHSGVYMCLVSLITSSTLYLPLNSTATSAITVQIPRPMIEISTIPENGPYYAGSTLSLRCSIEVDSALDVPYLVNVEWLKSGTMLRSDGRVSISNVTQQSSRLYLTSVDLSPLSVTLDTGMYTCRVMVDTDPPMLYVQRIVHSDMEAITSQSPTLVININPTTLTVLDVSTYNLISINCNVTQPPVVTIPKTIAWRQTSPSEVVQPLSHDGTNINITSSGLENSASTSQLSVYATAAGRWRYTCSASLHVPGDPVISYSQTAEVIVKGSSAPVQPIDTVHTTLSSELAVIQWLVPEIAYTPETYTVTYGTDRTMLNYTSEVVIGSTDVTAVNQVYSVTLRNLQSNTRYYYQVVATNNIGTNSSVISDLMTPQPVLLGSITIEGSSIAGEPLTLTCSVTRVNNVTGNIVLQWIGPAGAQLTSNGTVTVGIPITSGATTTINIHFPALYTSNAGQYTCQGELVSSDIMYTVLALQDVIVQVPAPIVSIGGLLTQPLYTGTSLQLMCSFELTSFVDTIVGVNGVWRRGGEQITNSSRVNISTVTAIQPSTFQTTASISPLSNTMDSGQYNCQLVFMSNQFVRFADASNQVAVMIEALPLPIISIVSEGSSLAGENFTITCTSTVVAGLSDSVVVATSWTDSEGNLLQPDANLISNSNTSLALMFSPLFTSHGGQYFCTVTTSIAELSIQQMNSVPLDITVQIPPPYLEISGPQSDANIAGMPAELRCTIDFDDAVDTAVAVEVMWLINEMNVNGTVRRRVLRPVMMGDSRYQAILQFDTLSSTFDSGNHMCIATLYPTEAMTYITNVTRTTMYTFTVIDPTITTVVSPTMYSGLDADPFNTFTLMCTARKPSSIVPALDLSWYHNEMQLDNSITGVSILEEEASGGAERSSTLIVDSATTASSGVYICTASISVPESNTVTSNQSATVTIRGPAAPNVPIILSSTVGAVQATINWIVTAIVYTPETYFIVYGLSNDTLDLRSGPIGEATNITDTNVAYSVAITGLRPFTQYYYRVDARNSFTTTESTIETFQTTEAAPTAPPNSLIVSIGSRSVTLSWDLPNEDRRNGIITSYTAGCSDSGGVQINTTTTVGLTTTFEGLLPYSFYSCSVFATTSGGDGPAAMLNFTTASDVPEDSPVNVQVAGSSPSSVFVTWITPSTPNGIITGYSLYVNYSDGSPIAMLQSDTSTTNYTLTNLQPYQLVTVQVSARTAAGEGPLSEPAMGRAREYDVLPPDVNIIASGMSVAGQTFSLLCRVTTPDGLTSEPQIRWLSPQGNVLSSGGELIIGNQPIIGNPSRLTTYSIQFSPLLTSHGGAYTCQATVSSPYQTVQQSTTRTANVSVQIPPPTLSVLPPIAPVYAGSLLMLNCTIQLSSAVDSEVVVSSMWRKNGVLLVDSAQRRIPDPIQTNNSSQYQAQLIFNPLQLNTDDGLYMCEVAIESNADLSFVLSGGSGSNNVSLRAVVPTLVAEMRPPTVTALDILPYNTFTLRCIANVPANVILQKTFVWRNGSNIITDSGDTVLISNLNTAMPESTSELTVNGPMIGIYTYYCTVTISVPGGLDISTFTTGVATVEGRRVPAQPSGVQTVNISSSSVTVQWVVLYLSYTPEQYTVYYGTVRERLDQRSTSLSSSTDISASNTTYEISLQGLTPNTIYFYQLHSVNTYAEITTAVMTFMTSEAGPSSPPIDFLVAITSPYSLSFSWNPPPAGTQNGVITAYTLTCQPDESVLNLPATYIGTGPYTITGFNAGSVYNCSVYASTAGGNGPPAIQIITTPDDVPGPVIGLSFTKISATVLQITWSEPQPTNGAIQVYSVQVETTTDSVFQASIPGDQNSILVPNLNKYIPYNVSIKASTSVGFGPLTSNWTFTEEGTPNYAPKNLDGNRLNVTHMNITWIKLSLEEARGVVTGYTVSYDTTDSHQRKEAVLEFAQPEDSYKVIGGLGFTTSYAITVSASTAVGQGISSPPIIVNAPPSSTFQLRMQRVGNCNTWRLRDTLDKVQFISEEVASELRRRCQCSISAAYITAAQLSCDPQISDDVIFRAILSSTTAVSNTDFITILQEWVRSETAAVAVGGINLNIDAMCQVLLQSFSDPICPSSASKESTTSAPKENKSSSSTPNIIAPIVGAIAGAVVLILVVIIAIQIFNRCHKGRKYEFRHSDHHVQSGQLELHDRYEAAPPLPLRHTASATHRDDDESPVAKKKAVEADVSPATLSNDYECIGFDNPNFGAARPTDIDETDETITKVGGDKEKVDLTDDSI